VTESRVLWEFVQDIHSLKHKVAALDVLSDLHLDNIKELARRNAELEQRVANLESLLRASQHFVDER
jgi:hypothetical protein